MYMHGGQIACEQAMVGQKGVPMAAIVVVSLRIFSTDAPTRCGWHQSSSCGTRTGRSGCLALQRLLLLHCHVGNCW
jgi:hypothetical protein